jgi:hypothetical protein
MYKILSIILIIGAISANAQTPWYISGNTTVGTEKIGSISGNFPLEFYFNNINLMTLQTTKDLDLTQTVAAYKIENNKILWHNNIPSSIFVGVGTGFTGIHNTFVGADAAGALNNTSDYKYLH